MIYLQFPQKVKFISGFIYNKESIYYKVKEIMEKKWGIIDYESEPISFNFTDYYCKEMGEYLIRRFISFKRLQKPDNFVKIKLFCIELEKKFSYRNHRKINIDPGYLNDAKLVLVTTKNFYHRIYLSKGIFAEVTLYYTKKNFSFFPWTYPDYRTDEYRHIFLKIREIYLKQTRICSKKRLK